ncbi:hypothetical protein [Aureibacter tunicatorum]|uniref:Uncharacterized protein n=1 Tax=Aureibacter tunicatorum TaxID=866807 RepID=A0AAE3XRP7_9BACT|nr:hypothetical protein [Aureibacter tunicatorum]MDR6240833.1 hypothetical protein [Aureibacter tunicatorum]BDD06834.1 hypothetical protein AUTU_43170 [Aureibacter tunicatorum]
MALKSLGKKKNTTKTNTQTRQQKCKSKTPPLQAYFIARYPTSVTLGSPQVELNRQTLSHSFYNYKYIRTKTHLSREHNSQSQFNMKDESPLPKDDFSDFFFNPEFKVTYGAEMALEDCDHPQTLFACPKIIEDSNHKLEAQGSPLRLEQDLSQALLLPNMFHDKQERAFATRPVYKGKSDTIGESSDCLRFAENILGYGSGKVFELILEEYMSGKSYHHPFKDFSTPERLIKFWVERSAPIPEGFSAHEAYDQHGGDGETAKAYKELEKDEAKAFDKCKRMGLNQFAMPTTGEAFRVYGLEAHKIPFSEQPVGKFPQTFSEYLENDFIDWRDPNTDSFNRIGWNMHNAGVVARTNSDFVTLENVAREQRAEMAFVSDFISFYCRYGSFRKELDALLESESFTYIPADLSSRRTYPDRVAIMKRCLSELLSMNKITERLRLRLEFLQKAQLDDAKAVDENKLFYFSMYGLESGQSFHEKHKHNVGYCPTTIRFRKSPGQVKEQAMQQVDEGMAKAKKWMEAPDTFVGIHELDQPVREFYEKCMSIHPKIIEKLEASMNQAEMKQAMTAYEALLLESEELQILTVKNGVTMFGHEFTEDDAKYINNFFVPKWKIKEKESGGKNLDLLERIEKLAARTYWCFHRVQYSISMR